MAPDLGRIGPLLREAREKKGLTINQVSNALFITNLVVGAIETGNWSNLPHPVYVKGYLKHYAALLGTPGLLGEGKAVPHEASLATTTGSSNQPRFLITRLRGVLHHLVKSAA